VFADPFLQVVAKTVAKSKSIESPLMLGQVGQRDYKMMDRFLKTAKGFEEREMETLYGR